MPPPADRPRVVVVGGGITGLAAAWSLRQRAWVTVLEASGHLGGKVRTGELAGVPVEEGPDTFLAREPHARDLAVEVGLGDDLVEPATGEAFVWSRGQLRPLPRGHVLGIPVQPLPLLRSGLLTPGEVARAGLDLVLPRSRPGPSADPSVAEVVGRRMGRAVVERLAEPLIGGINAGRADELSLAATAPQVAEAAATSRSLVLGLRRQARRRRRRDAPASPATPLPLFLGVTGGMGRLVERLVAGLAAGGVELRTEAPATAIEPVPGTGAFQVAVAGDRLPADAVVVTVPAYSAARLLPTVAKTLESIRYASVAVCTLAYRREDVDAPLAGAGFLVPRVERRLMSACTFSTTKWPSLAASGLVLLRASTGRAGDDRHADLDDAELVGSLHAELAEAVGVRRPPVASLVSRWRDGFPQYQPGHLRRVERIESTLASEMPGVVVAGAAYRGLGITACVRQAQEAANRVAGRVGTGG